MLNGFMVFIAGSFTGMIGAALWEAFCELTRPQRRRVVKEAARKVISKTPAARPRTTARPRHARSRA